MYQLVTNSQYWTSIQQKLILESTSLTVTLEGISPPTWRNTYLSYLSILVRPPWAYFFLDALSTVLLFKITWRIAPVSLAVVLLDHVQHTLLKGLSTQGVWYAHAQIRCHPETKSKVRPKKKYALPGWVHYPKDYVVFFSTFNGIQPYLMLFVVHPKYHCKLCYYLFTHYKL